ncbi:hypothetical protein RB601_001322 [Gaeumannomyces tritici]
MSIECYAGACLARLEGCSAGTKHPTYAVFARELIITFATHQQIITIPTANMKFFAAVLALAATAVAAPASSGTFVKDSIACACVNSQGVYAAGDLCTQADGGHTRDLPGGLCFPRTARSADMTKVFTDAICKATFGNQGWDKAVCKPVKICTDPYWGPDIWTQC